MVIPLLHFSDNVSRFKLHKNTNNVVKRSDFAVFAASTRLFASFRVKTGSTANSASS